MAGKDKTGREMAAVGRLRVVGEPNPEEFDREHHPGIIARALRMMTLEETAAVVGIPVAMLLTWLEIHPEMEQARARVARRDLEILESLEDTAIGDWDAERGRYVGGNPRLLMFLARTRLDMREPKETKGDVADMRTPAEIHRAALMFLERMAKDSDPVVA